MANTRKNLCRSIKGHIKIIKKAYGHSFSYVIAVEENYYQRDSKTRKALEMISKEQHNNDILVIPCQFGIKYSGCSIRHADELFNVSEFGLGIFEVLCMILTHKERLVYPNDLSIGCSGDYILDSNNKFTYSPRLLSLEMKEILFHAVDIKEANQKVGVVSGFIY